MLSVSRNKIFCFYFTGYRSIKLEKEYLKKITAAAIVIAGIGIFATGVSADNKLGCVDFFDAYSQTESSVTLKWDKGINADGYSVYRKESNSENALKEIADIDNPDTLQFKDKTVSSGKKYDYAIRTYQVQNGERIYSKSESLKTASSPLAVKKFEVAAQNEKSISLKWSKVKDATGYTVYRMDEKSGKTYKKICDVKGTEKYTDKGLTPSKAYSYYIKAYIEVDGEKSYSEKSTVIDTATSPSQVKALVNDKKGTDYLRIKWEKSEGASGYVIYRKTDNEYDYETEVTYDEYGNAEYTSNVGKYIKYAVVKGGNKTTFEEKDLNSCQGYCYRVVPYFKSKDKYYYGDYREVICGTVTSTPEVTAYSRLKRLMAKWYPVSGAEGYEIFVSDKKDSGFKSYGTTEDTIFLTKQLEANKTYYMKVCAYYTVNKKQKIYSNSTVKKIKCTQSNKVDKYNVGDTYIEIDLDMQHMWYFRKGKLEISTPVVTGLRYYRDTQTGLHEVYFKQSPANLVGETWDTYVNYWMAVTYDGQGIHDANWRYDSEYGGNTYMYNGSHGCINTPYDKVQKMYELVEVGTPVVIYQPSDEENKE